MGLAMGVDARAAAEVPAGRGRYVRELLRALAALPEASSDRFLLYAREPWGDLDERFSWRLIPVPDPLWHLGAARRASCDGEVFLSTNSYLTAWFTTVPTAIVVHDLVAFSSAPAQSRAATIERATIRPALRRARALPCVSEATRADLIQRFPAAASKTSVIPHGADERLAEAQAGNVPKQHSIDRPYVLAVGTLEPRKNLGRLVEAWSLLPPELQEAHLLVLVGPRGWDDSDIVRTAQEAGARLLGRVSDEELGALYAGCACFAYPSLQEGFGLPVLEAMCAGAPVVTSNVSSLPEVAGDAALLVDPLDPAAIAEAIARVLSDQLLADELRARSRRQAGTFSWARTARETRQLLAAIARPPRARARSQP
jgi:glycosyltransferase involved in cell wall biosynthesis